MVSFNFSKVQPGSTSHPHQRQQFANRREGGCAKLIRKLLFASLECCVTLTMWSTGKIVQFIEDNNTLYVYMICRYSAIKMRCLVIQPATISERFSKLSRLILETIQF